MDTPNRSFPPGDLRVSDADRERAVAELSEHFQTGRLSQEEFEDRSGRALQARTESDLSELFTDLPQGTRSAAGGPPAATNSGGVRRVKRIPVARLAIVCVILAIIAGNVVDNVFNFGHTHTVSFSWLVPVLIIGFVFRRHIAGRR